MTGANNCVHVRVSVELHGMLSYQVSSFQTTVPHKEEWTLLCKHLLFYPNILENSVRDVESGIIEPQLLSRFLMSLCANFSIYYRRVRILTHSKAFLSSILFLAIHKTPNRLHSPLCQQNGDAWIHAGSFHSQLFVLFRGMRFT
uniref:DALR anticodon binding domain-containing protein n=1 Tax=Timema monikensis TaxID=170555 RepID=A0A7R9E9Y4_9NEOP|nr:unnamed protein product [Timema monikensis]